MPVKIVLDYPQRHRARRLRRSINTLIGGLMVFLGVVAAIMVLPSAFFVYGIVAGVQELQPGSHAENLLAAATSISITVVGLKVGLKLLRGNRKLVLFLRRFGYSNATRVATFAAAKTI